MSTTIPRTNTITISNSNPGPNTTHNLQYHPQLQHRPQRRVVPKSPSKIQNTNHISCSISNRKRTMRSSHGALSALIKQVSSRTPLIPPSLCPFGNAQPVYPLLVNVLLVLKHCYDVLPCPALTPNVQPQTTKNSPHKYSRVQLSRFLGNVMTAKRLANRSSLGARETCPHKPTRTRPKQNKEHLTAAGRWPSGTLPACSLVCPHP